MSFDQFLFFLILLVGSILALAMKVSTMGINALKKRLNRLEGRIAALESEGPQE